jgi:mitochondrial fission protein ELM1
MSMAVADKQADLLLPSALRSVETGKQRQSNPIIAFIIGGAHSEFRWTREDATRLAKNIQASYLCIG